MDEASSDLPRHLGSRVHPKPWLVCATRRPAGGGFVAAQGNPPVPAMSLRLDPLPEADAHELAPAAAAAAEELPPEELAAITERAGGNPLFVQELVAATRVSGQGLETLPESVEGVVTSRIDNLAPADRALLRWAAVLGASFSGELVPRVLQDDPDAALDSVHAWPKQRCSAEMPTSHSRRSPRPRRSPARRHRRRYRHCSIAYAARRFTSAARWRRQDGSSRRACASHGRAGCSARRG
jgi:hypothetical protein